VAGTSDRFGAFPAADPQTPDNVAATIYQALGIPRTAEWRATNRTSPDDLREDFLHNPRLEVGGEQLAERFPSPRLPGHPVAFDWGAHSEPPAGSRGPARVGPVGAAIAEPTRPGLPAGTPLATPGGHANRDL